MKVYVILRATHKSQAICDQHAFRFRTELQRELQCKVALRAWPYVRITQEISTRRFVVR